MRISRRRTRLLIGCGALLAAFAGAGGGVAAAAQATGAAALTPGTGAVPKGFVATSVSFPTKDEGYVLGTAPCAHEPCTSVIRTVDRGSHWAGVPAPAVALGNPGGATGISAWGIRFATTKVGFVFGKGLWETVNGGADWVMVKPPSTTVNSLEISDGQVLAVATPCAPGQCIAQKSSLYRRPLSGGSWHLVAKLASAFDLEGTATIATAGKVAAILNGEAVLVTSNGGLSVTAHPTGCTNADVGGPVGLAVAGTRALALLCAGQGAAGSVGKAVYLSSDLGAHWTSAGSPPAGGDPGAIAATPGHIVVSAASGASELYYSTSGKHWTTAFGKGDGGAGFADLGFTTTADGAVVYGPVYTNGTADGFPGKVLLTGNGGASWQTQSF